MVSSSADLEGSRSRRAAWAAVAVVAVVLPLFIGGYHLHLLIMAGIFSILAVSLGLVIGYAGLLSLGHAAFFGIGAYTSALLFLHFGVSMWWGMAAAAVLAAFVAGLLGAVILRVRGNRFVIVTIAFAEIMRLVAHNWVDVTRGQMGLAGIQPPRVEMLGQVLDFSAKPTFYYLVVVIAALSIFAITRIAKSPLGWGFLALRENEALGESIGVSAYRHALLVFVIGAFFAGLAGSLYAHYISFIGPDLFYFSYTTIMLVMVVMGGLGTIAGPFVGALVFTLLPEYLRVASEYRLVFFGAILVVGIMLVPRGLVEVGERARAVLTAATARRRGAGT
jgi:branched-chain amino acid transport system permease protein